MMRAGDLLRANALLCLCGLVLPAQAGGTPPPAVIAAVTRELEAGGSDTRAAASVLKPLRIGKEAAWRADFEAAGETDWCGSGGCRVMLYVETKQAWLAVFDRQVRRFRLDGERLTVELYGKYCGKAGNAPCMARYRWDAGQRVWQPMGKAPPPLEARS